MTFLSACPIKLEVSSTRPAPHNGLLSSAARNGRGPNSWVWRACSMGRSMSHGSSLRFNESLAKGHHCSEAYGCLLGVQTVQHSLEASIHEDRFNHLVIGDARVRLQNDRQGLRSLANEAQFFLLGTACSFRVICSAHALFTPAYSTTFWSQVGL